MFCAISGQVPTDPVVSTKTGHLFERSLIEKALASEDKCPVSGVDLTADDLLVVQATQTAKPRPITATSIPGLLSHFQNEWDAVMLETHTLRQHLDAARKELSQMLYQHDAACRVIARLVRERDEARAMLAQRQGAMAEQTAAVAAGESMDVDAAAAEPPLSEITAEVIGQIEAKGEQLRRGRKKRPIAKTLASQAHLRQLSQQSAATPHSSTKQGVLCVDVSPRDPAVTVSGGVDKDAVVFDHGSNKVLAKLSGHSKKVTACLFHPDAAKPVCLTASADKTVKIWTDFAEAATMAAHDDEVLGLSVHPTGDYFASVGKEGAWCFSSLERGTCLKTVTVDSSSAAFTSVDFHPDGVLLGMGTEDHLVRIWDMKSQTSAHAFEGHTAAVTAMKFSENGYYMASVGLDRMLKLWDLRKLQNVKNLELPAAGHAVAFDKSGTYLAAAFGSDVSVHVVKEWAELATLSGHKKQVTGLAFNHDATKLFTVAMDRNVKVWG